MNDLALVPHVPSATLPASYTRAKEALTTCVRIDECMEWANKAEALASYARQAEDETLRKLADRIQARAIRRCGELLKQFQTGPKGGRPADQGTGNGRDAPTVSQRQAAERAGLSKDQEVQAVRVANVPAEIFEAAVESETPPTVTKLASMGTTKRPPVIDVVPVSRSPAQAAPPGFTLATDVIGTLKEFAQFCAQNPPESVASGVYGYEVPALKQAIAAIDSWLDRFIVHLREQS